MILFLLSKDRVNHMETALSDDSTLPVATIAATVAVTALLADHFPYDCHDRYKIEQNGLDESNNDILHNSTLTITTIITISADVNGFRIIAKIVGIHVNDGYGS